MNDERCPYEGAAREAAKLINTNEVCAFDQLLNEKARLGFIAARAFCKRCKKVVNIGTFDGPSVYSLTEFNPEE